MYHLILAGTYSTQPAVTTQTFGHKYGGFIYAFLFSCDIINNFLVATLSTVSAVGVGDKGWTSSILLQEIKEAYGWLGLFLIVSLNGVFALLATLLFPYNPRYLFYPFVLFV